MSQILTRLKIPGIRLAGLVILVVLAIRLWAHPEIEITDGWGIDQWSARQVPEKIERPAPRPPALAELLSTPDFQKQSSERKREILALWSTQSFLYLRDQPGFDRAKAVEEIQKRVDVAAQKLGLESVTQEHVNLGLTANILVSRAFLIAIVVIGVEVWKSGIFKKKKN